MEKENQQKKWKPKKAQKAFGVRSLKRIWMFSTALILTLVMNKLFYSGDKIFMIGFISLFVLYWLFIVPKNSYSVFSTMAMLLFPIIAITMDSNIIYLTGLLITLGIGQEIFEFFVGIEFRLKTRNRSWVIK